jgi:hypothetical protein
MTKFLIPAAALIAVLAVTDAAFAGGVSSKTPGHETRVRGTHGASFNAPGQMYLRAHKMPRGHHPGASGYAPGHEFR